VYAAVIKYTNIYSEVVPLKLFELTVLGLQFAQCAIVVEYAFRGDDSSSYFIFIFYLYTKLMD